MQKDTLDDLFDDLKGKFDVNEPNKDHELRFLDKLKANDIASNETKKSSGFNWKPFLSIAAALVICFSVFTTLQNDSEALDLASVSPELSETQDFFTVTIENELKKLNKERSPLTEQIINDALKQVDVLETNYQALKTDLTESGSDQRVIYAMITNFQNRIDILNAVLEQIETIKELKSNKNETKNTI
jgi:biopolymer transport protein ExbD